MFLRTMRAYCHRPSTNPGCDWTGTENLITLHPLAQQSFSRPLYPRSRCGWPIACSACPSFDSCSKQIFKLPTSIRSESVCVCEYTVNTRPGFFLHNFQKLIKCMFLFRSTVTTVRRKDD